MAGVPGPKKKRAGEGGGASQYFEVFSTQQWAEESPIRNNWYPAHLPLWALIVHGLGAVRDAEAPQWLWR